jgi:glycosyltransferase involved in cell wall biosynthesis
MIIWGNNMAIKQPLVSIIIPCYDYGKYVLDAIDSCLNNTYKNFEIIVVNDCSTDPYTNKVLSNLKKPKTRVINHIKNKGLPAARNTGIKASRPGKYILPLDADDTINPDFIQKTVRVLEDRPNVGFVSTGRTHFGTQNLTHVPPQYNFYDLLFQNLCSVTSLFRRKAWEEVGGFNEKMQEGYEDWDFWISLGEKGWHGYRIPDILFNYRKHGRSMINDSLKIHDELVKQIRENHPDLYKPEKLAELAKIWKKGS